MRLPEAFQTKRPLRFRDDGGYRILMMSDAHLKPGKEERLVVVVENLRKAMEADMGEAKAKGKLFEEMERAANYLESCEMVPMSVPPTAKIFAWRKLGEPPMDEVLRFARALAVKLESKLPKKEAQ